MSAYHVLYDITMNFLHHRQRSQCHVLPIPDGLQELMSDISREVLRCQPSIDCTYKFIADYLDAMINTREKSQIAMGIIEEAILSTDEVYSQFLKCNIPKDKTDSFLEVLEKTFRRFVEQKRRMTQNPRYITFQADDLLDELLRKCDMTKVEILRSRPAIQWAYTKFVQTYISAIEGTFDVADLYANTNKLIISCDEFEKLEKSAVTIQKTYRGYYTRKQRQQLVQPEKSINVTKHYRGYKVRRNLRPKTEVVDKGDSFEHFKKYARDNEDLNKAAIKIQATYKGFNTRKKMNVHRNGEDH